MAGRTGARRYRLPPGRGLRRQHLRRERKELAGRYYQFLSGHAAIGAYLRDRLHKIDSDRCWWCDTGQRQSRFHLVARCPVWAGQARVMWGRIRRLCEWERPRAPSVRRMFEDVRATPAVLSFRRDTWAGRMVSLAPCLRLFLLGDGWEGRQGGGGGGGGGERARESSSGEESSPGPP